MPLDSTTTAVDLALFPLLAGDWPGDGTDDLIGRPRGAIVDSFDRPGGGDGTVVSLAVVDLGSGAAPELVVATGEELRVLTLDDDQRFDILRAVPHTDQVNAMFVLVYLSDGTGALVPTETEVVIGRGDGTFRDVIPYARPANQVFAVPVDIGAIDQVAMRFADPSRLELLAPGCR